MTIGSVSRPWLPSQNSERCSSSDTGWAAQKSGPTVRRVVSSATALAPFSQNSAGRRRPAGSGQAQPGQSKPPLWFSRLRACAVRRIPACEMPRFSATVTAGIPAAWCLGGLTARSASSISVTGAASAGDQTHAPDHAPCAVTRRARQSHRVDAWWHHDLVPVYRDSAVVLRVTKLGEADRIVTLLTRREGRVRAVAKGVRRTKSRFGSRLEPFSHVDLQLYAGRNLDIVTQAETLDPFGPVLVADYSRYTCATAIVETAERLTSEEREPSLRLYLLVVSALRALTETDARPVPGARRLPAPGDGAGRLGARADRMRPLRHPRPARGVPHRLRRAALPAVPRRRVGGHGPAGAGGDRADGGPGRWGLGRRRRGRTARPAGRRPGWSRRCCSGIWNAGCGRW